MSFRTVPLGRTGMQVSRYCLGTMMFGAIGNTDHADCARILDRALDAGINFVDTADMYSAGESELIVGKALQGKRDDVILASKGHFPLGDDLANRRGNSPRYLTKALDASLKRLGTVWIDLYQVHRPDADTDLAETLAALQRFVDQGKIRAFGCSVFPADQLVDAAHLAPPGFRTEQPVYSLLSRGAETSVFPATQRLGMGVLTWSPLAFGFLSGKLRKGVDPASVLSRTTIQGKHFDLDDPANQAKLEAVEQFAVLAEDLGVTLPQLAVAFVLAHPAVTSVIIGPRVMEHLETLLPGDLELDDATLDRIDAIVAPGVNLTADAKWSGPWMTDARLRRRAPGDRAV